MPHCHLTTNFWLIALSGVSFVWRRQIQVKAENLGCSILPPCMKVAAGMGGTDTAILEYVHTKTRSVKHAWAENCADLVNSFFW